MCPPSHCQFLSARSSDSLGATTISSQRKDCTFPLSLYQELTLSFSLEAMRGGWSRSWGPAWPCQAPVSDKVFSLSSSGSGSGSPYTRGKGCFYQPNALKWILRCRASKIIHTVFPRLGPSPPLQRCARCDLRGLLLPLESAKSEEPQGRKHRMVEKGSCQGKVTSLQETVPTTKSEIRSNAQNMSQDPLGSWMNRTMSFLGVVNEFIAVHR